MPIENLCNMDDINMDQSQFKTTLIGFINGIDRNKRKYNLNIMQESFDKYIQLHKKEIKDALNNCSLYECNKELNNLGIYAIPQSHPPKSEWYLIGIKFTPKEFTDVYREFIEENKYKRITSSNRNIPIPRIKCPESNGSNIKYDSRKLFDDLVK